MSKIWSDQARGVGLGGKTKRQVAREAKYRYQAKEVELETAREELARLEGSLRSKRGELSRLFQLMEKRRLELIQSEGRRQSLEHLVKELEEHVSTQHAHVRRVEREVGDLREAASRVHHFGG